MDKYSYVYIMASKKNGTLYTGVTSNLIKRVWQHKNGLIESFTKRYQVHNLVYYEQHSAIIEAITREKFFKSQTRAWKIMKIEMQNKEWQDLFEEICS